MDIEDEDIRLAAVCAAVVKVVGARLSVPKSVIRRRVHSSLRNDVDEAVSMLIGSGILRNTDGSGYGLNTDMTDAQRKAYDRWQWLVQSEREERRTDEVGNYAAKRVHGVIAQHGPITRSTLRTRITPNHRAHLDRVLRDLVDDDLIVATEQGFSTDGCAPHQW